MVIKILDCLERSILQRLCRRNHLDDRRHTANLRTDLADYYRNLDIDDLEALLLNLYKYEIANICDLPDLGLYPRDQVREFALSYWRGELDKNAWVKSQGFFVADEEEDEGGVEEEDGNVDEGDEYLIDLTNIEMMTLTVEETLNGEEGSDTKKCVYLFSDEKDMLYIGKCQNKTIRNRLLEHLGMGFFPAETVFDKTLQKAGKFAMNWTIQILTLEECNKIFKKFDMPLRRKLKKAENALIRFIEPKYNIQGNPNYKEPSP